MARACAYCRTHGETLTREHLFPAFLDRLHPRYTVHLSSAFPGVVTTKAPVIRDVCKRCNNVRLGALDRSASALCEKYLRRLVKPGESGYFRYDYHTLCRWLWKLSYNKARTGDDDRTLYEPLVPYILGDSPAPAFPETALVGVIRAEEATEKERAVLRSRFIYPRLVRLGLLERAGVFAATVRVGRLLSVNSYMFWLIAWKPDVNRQRRRDLANRIGNGHGMVVLSEGTVDVHVPASTFAVRDYLARRFSPPVV